MTGFDFTDAQNLLSATKKIVITTHVSPDGDAIGSSLALALYLRKTGHEAIVLTPDNYPAFLKWLPDNENVLHFDTNEKEGQKAIDEANLIFCLDFNTPDRLSGLQHVVESKDCPKILIDHHQEPEQWTDVMFADSNASSTAELIYRFIEGLNGLEYLDKEIGDCLYTGLVTDTGSFKFSSTTSETLRITAELMDLGVDTSKVQNLIYDNSSEDRLRLMGYALTEKLIIVEEYNTAIISLDAEELRRFNHKTGDTEGLVNYPLSISSVKISIFISEKGKDVRLSFRSKGTVPVHLIAKKHFSGGGHVNAAGGISNKSVEGTIKFILQILPEFKDQLC